jgi:hypothetical protein
VVVAFKASGLTIIVKSCFQIFGNDHGTATFNVMALKEMYKSTVLE